MNFAGLRGLPNADWCEDNKVETARSNVLGVMNLVDCCFLHNIHITHFGSACIFEHDSDHPAGIHRFTEADEPFYADSFYSHTRLLSENVCNFVLKHRIQPFLTHKPFTHALAGY